MPPVRRERQETEPTHRPVVGAVVVAALAVVLVIAFVGLPREGAALPGVARYAMEVALPKWGITEPVNEIVYGTRGFDTFGETFLLLGAVVCVVVLTRRREPRGGFIGEEVAGGREQSEDDPSSGGGSTSAREAEQQEDPDEDRTDRPIGPATPDDWALGTPAPERAQSMTVIVRIASRVTTPILAVAGIYLCAWGYSPGGGFPGGAVMAGVILLLYAAFGYRRISRAVQPTIFETLELGGALVIIGSAVLGLVLKGSFSANWIPLAEPETIPSGGILQLFSGSEFLEVATGLALVIFALLGMEHDWTPDEDTDDRGGQQQKAGRR